MQLAKLTNRLIKKKLNEISVVLTLAYSYFNLRCRKTYATRPQGVVGNLLINLPNLAMTHPYTKQITQGIVYGTFDPPMAATNAELQPNNKQFSATHTTFRSRLVSLTL